jgi:hypothetical protein
MSHHEQIPSVIEVIPCVTLNVPIAAVLGGQKIT